MSYTPLTAEQVAEAKARHAEDGCDCGGYFYADAPELIPPSEFQGYCGRCRKKTNQLPCPHCSKRSAS